MELKKPPGVAFLPPPFPANAPVDEHAIVIDETLFRRTMPELFMNLPQPVYTLEAMVRNVEKTVAIILNAVMNRHKKDKRKKQQYLHHERTEAEYDEFISYVKKLRMYRGRMTKHDIINNILFTQFFRIGSGYVIDEHEKDNPIAERMRWYQKQMACYLPLVPKVFFADKIDNAGYLSPEVKRACLQQYGEMLEQAVQRGTVLASGDKHYLLGGIQMLTSIERSEHNLKANIGDDSKLVAAAYAIPAHGVTVYSHDNDIKALVMLTRHLAPEKNIEMVLMSGSRN